MVAKIEAILIRQFDLRQKSREEELRSLEERVRKIRETFEKRQRARAEIVRHRLDEILRDADGLGWGETTENVSVRSSLPQTGRANALDRQRPWPLLLRGREVIPGLTGRLLML